MADTKKAVAEVKQEAEKAVAEVKQETEKVAAEAKKEVQKAEAEIKKTVKTAKKKAAKVPAKAKAAAKKAAAAPAKAKAAVEKTAKKAVTGETSPVVYVQYQGDEEKVEDLVAAATAAFRAEHSHTKVTGLKLYIKPEERAAYYVVNDKFAGRVDF
ncbi:MAG: hypothetical protein IJV43_02320 [Oscillospiraceae bacterium]|nr:hypothetical protein [Oscillospiraceae bacterium]